MKKNTRKILALLMAVTMTTTFNATNVFAYDYTFTTSTAGIQPSNNILNTVESTTKYGQSIKSAIDVAADGTITRLESVNGNIFVETYNSNYEYINTKQLPYELPIFGGAFFGSEYNFLVFGQANVNEHEDREVVRVIKYDKNWNALGSVSAYGINTQTPFSSSGLAMIEQNGILYIRTSHRMMKTPDDGKNHQATLSMGVNIADMTFSGMVYKLDYKTKGYISHSFNSLLTKTGSEIIAVDLGDAFPRTIVAFRGKNIAGGTLVNTDLFDIPGSKGDNSTGISLGGLEYTSYTSDAAVKVTNNAVVAGRMEADYSEATYDAETHIRNIFVTVASVNDDGTLGANGLKMVTNYLRAEGIKTTTPKLVKVAENRLYVMWQEYTTKVGDGPFKYVLIDNNGDLVSEIMTANAKLSDAQPVVVGNKVMWYATTGDVPTFYTLDIETNEVTSNVATGATNAYEKIVVEYEPEKPAVINPDTGTGTGTDTGTGSGSDNTGSDNSDDSTDSTDDTSNTTTNNTNNANTTDKTTDYNSIVAEQAKDGNEIIVELTADNSSAEFNSTTINSIIDSKQPLNITQGMATTSIASGALQGLKLNSNDVLSVSVVPQRVAFTVTNGSAVNNKINDAFLNNALKFDIAVNDKSVENLDGKVTLTYDVSSYNLTNEQMGKLQAVEVLPNGEVKYIDSKIVDGKVVFETDKTGVYTVVILDEPTTVNLEIDLNKGVYMLNNNAYKADATPKIINGRTMVPIRVIAEAFGANVDWIASTNTINITLDNKNVEMIVGKTTEGMDVPPTVINGRTFVPLRYVSEVLDANIDWNQETNKISITK